MIDRAERAAAIARPTANSITQIAERVSGWLGDTDDDAGDRLVIMHGISSRVMRGVMTGQPSSSASARRRAGAFAARSLVMIERGVETIVHLGGGGETV